MFDFCQADFFSSFPAVYFIHNYVYYQNWLSREKVNMILSAHKSLS